MMRDGLTIFLVWLLALLCWPMQLHAQTDETQNENDLWARYAMDLNMQEQSGEGWEWIIAEAVDSQFVLFGEQHGIKAIPEITGMAYSALKPFGYDALALEISPWLGEISTRNGVIETLAEHPFELSFNADALIALMDQVQKEAGEVWGLDQPVTAIHSYKRLSEILPTARSRDMARGLHLKAALQMGRYIQNDNSEDLRRLRSAIDGPLSDEAELLFSSLEKSMLIFSAYFAGQSGEGPRGLSDEVREAYITQNFSEKIRQRSSEQDGPAKALILMGGAHIMEGIGPNGVRTFGDYAQELAAESGLDALHISIHRYRADPIESPPEAIFSNGDVALVDLKSVRSASTQAWRDNLSPNLRRKLEQYDAAIFLRAAYAEQDSAVLITSLETEFRQSLIRTLLIPATCALFILVLLLVWLRAVFQLAHPRMSLAFLSPVSPWVAVTVLSFGTLILLVIQILRIRIVGVEMNLLSLNLVAVLALFVVAIISAILMIQSWRKSWWGTSSRSIFSLVCIATVILAGFMYHWNLGGMFG